MRVDWARLRRGSEEGWASLALLLLAGFVVAWAVDEASWVLGRERLTAFLPWTMTGGILAGFVAARLGWGRLRGHLAGAAAAALIVPVLVGSVLLPQQGDLGALFHASADAATEAFLDLLVRGRGSTSQYGHFQLALGLLMWATGQFSAYAIYRHHRPLSAIAALGLTLVVNVGLTTHDQLPLLVVFSVLALLLLVRLHSFDERDEWLRRRIGDPGPLTSLTLRGGSVFVGIAVLGSLTLTSVAKSAPLQDTWTGAESWLVDVGRALQPYFTFLTSPRGAVGVDFGPTASIGQVWTTGGAVELTIQRPAGDDTRYYWRAATYDEFLGTEWRATDAVRVSRDAGASLLADSAEGAGSAGRRAVTVRVLPSGFRGSQIIGPSTPASVDVPTTVSLIGSGGYIATIDGSRAGKAYSVTSMSQVFGDTDPKDITANKLRAAGTVYPAGMEPYLQVPDGAIGPDARKLLDTVRAGLAGAQETPYDWAAAMVATLTNADLFTYDPDISDLDCSRIGVVECFARYRRGFCQYYASEMAILLREVGIPTRLVQGFLPGDRTGNTETVLLSSSHAWVEVYFPGYGWVDFDPTGGGRAQLGPIPTGRPVATPSATPRASSPGDGGDIPTRRPGESAAGGGTIDGGGPGSPGSAPFVAVAILLIASVGWLAFVAYRRGPREVSADGAWNSVTGLARRLGFGPRPTQTVYEYSAALGEMLPSVRPELQMVAQAKVEVSYGRHTLGDERLRGLRAATGRLRVGLLRLALRWPRRRRR